MEIIYTPAEIAELHKAVNKPKTPIEKKPEPEGDINLKKIDVAQLAKVGTIKKIESGTVIFEIGDLDDEFYLILKGKVDVICQADAILASLGAGDIFGEMSALENVPRSARVKAVEELVVFVMPADGLESLIINLPSLALRVMQILSSRVRQLNSTVMLLKGAENSGAENAQSEILELRRRVAELESASCEK